MRIHFNPYQFIVSMLFLIPGLILIGKNSNWYVALGVLLVIISATLKLEFRED